MLLSYKTIGMISPENKQNVYFCCHPDDFSIYFEDITNRILADCDCAIWYAPDQNIARNEDFALHLERMRLLIVPVTRKWLTDANCAFDFDVKFALERNIPILPLLLEEGIEPLFNEKCGTLHLLRVYDPDPTALPFREKVRSFFSNVLLNDDLRDRIRGEFRTKMFLSYRKMDRKHICSIMSRVHAVDQFDDVAFWYDEYLHAGEEFEGAIVEALNTCPLFALLVTPSIMKNVEDQHGNLHKNYVEEHEYPNAVAGEKYILPFEMEPTNREQLSLRYNIVDPIDANDATALVKALSKALDILNIPSKENTAEHRFLLGLAYLQGVDVEQNAGKAVRLITSAAEEGYLEAIDQLEKMYLVGLGTERSVATAHMWLEKKVETLEKIRREAPECDTQIRLVEAYIYLAEDAAASLHQEESDAAILLYQKAQALLTDELLADSVWGEEARKHYLSIQRLSAHWYEKRGLMDKAIALYTEVVSALEQATEENSGDLYHLRRLISAYQDMAIFSEKNHDWDAATAWALRAMEICEPLINANDQFKMLYVDLCWLATGSYIEDRNYGVAYRLVQEALTVCEKLYEQHSAFYGIRYANTLVRKVGVQQHLPYCNTDEMIADLEKAIALYKEHIANMDDLGYYHYSLALYRRGNLCTKLGDLRGATEWHAKSIEINETVLMATPTAEHCAHTAVVYLDSGSAWLGIDPWEARKLLVKAAQIYAALCQDDMHYMGLFQETIGLIRRIDQFIG